MLGRIELPQITGLALTWKDPACKHDLDHINELNLLGYHIMEAHLEPRDLFQRSPGQALLLPGGKPHRDPGSEFGAAVQLASRGSVI